MDSEALEPEHAPVDANHVAGMETRQRRTAVLQVRTQDDMAIETVILVQRGMAQRPAAGLVPVQDAHEPAIIAVMRECRMGGDIREPPAIRQVRPKSSKRPLGYVRRLGRGLGARNLEDLGGVVRLVRGYWGRQDDWGFGGGHSLQKDRHGSGA